MHRMLGLTRLAVVHTRTLGLPRLAMVHARMLGLTRLAVMHTRMLGTMVPRMMRTVVVGSCESQRSAAGHNDSNELIHVCRYCLFVGLTSQGSQEMGGTFS